MIPIEVKHLYVFDNSILFYIDMFDENDNELCYDSEISEIFGLDIEKYKERIKKVFNKACMYKGEMFIYRVEDQNTPGEQLKEIDEELLDRYKEEFTAELTLLILND